MNSLLEVHDLHVEFQIMQGKVSPVRGVSFTLNRGEILGVVGESGSGKSVAALSVMGLLPKPGGCITAGDILLDGKSIAKLNVEEFSKIRGKRIAMIFQEPMTSLNPVFRIGDQIREMLEIHEPMSKVEMKKRVIEMLSLVRIPDPEKIVACYPHQLSGGMRQRVMIAMALICNPDILIADEPTTALDVTIQAQILELLKDLVKRLNIGILFITHDLGVILEMANRLVIMYCGTIMEIGDTKEILFNPKHPYTKGLIQARPDNYHMDKGYYSIEGMVPSLLSLPSGCVFSTRCNEVKEICRQKVPEQVSVQRRQVRCWNYK